VYLVTDEKGFKQTGILSSATAVEVQVS